MTTILIADDIAENRYLLEALFKSMGFRVLSAENGAVALELARSESLDLVISDILMPVMDGFDLCRHMKMDERLKSVPFIFYTATYTESKHERFALSLGADRFILKPQEPAFLQSLVREVLGTGSMRPGPALDESLDAEMAYLRQHNEALFTKLDKKIKDLRASQMLIQNLFDNSPSLLYIVDGEGRFLHVNRQMELSLKRPWRELVGKTRELFIPKDVAEQFLQNDRRVLESGIPLTFEEVGQEPDGEHVYLTVKFPLRDEQGRNYAVCGISTDITDKKQLERDLQRLSDLHVMLYQINRAIRSASSEEALFREACRICVENGKFDLAWIGRPSATGTLLRADVVAGPFAADTRELEVPLDPAQPLAHTPSAVSLREGRTVVCQDWASGPSVDVWRTRFEGCGIRSSAALPIHREGQAAAVLNLYSRRSGFFTADRLALLEELVQDLSHALDGLVEAQRRAAAEAALRIQEMEYRATFDQGAVGLAQVSLEGVFLRVNRRFCELLGYPSEELVGKSFQAFTHPEDRGVSEETLRSSADPRQDRYHLQKRYLRKDGRVVWVDLSGGPVRGPDGRVLYLLSAFEDITPQKLQEQRILEEQTKLRTLLQTLPDLVWLKDLEGVYRFCNPRFEAFLGRTEAEILGRNDRDFFEPELAEWFRDHDRKALEAEGPSVNEERVTFASDGHQELLETIKTPIRDASGQVAGVLGIARDVTRGRQDQEQLRKLSRAVEQSPVAVVITDRAGAMEYVNPRFTDLTGYGPEEALGANPRLLKSGRMPRDIYADLWATILGGDVWHGELQNRKKNGDLYWEAISIAPIFDGAGTITHFVALKEDVSARKASEAALAESERRYHSLFDAMKEGFALHEVITDGQGNPADYRYVDVNPAFEAMVGVPRDRLIGHTVKEVLPGLEASWIEAFNGVARTAEAVRFEGYADTMGRWFQVFAFSPFPGLFALLALDITERVKAQERLITSEQQFRTLTENLPFLVARFDAELRHVYVSPMIEQITGLDREAFQGRTNEELGMPSELVARWNEELRAVLDRGEIRRFEFVFPSVAGPRTFASTLVPEWNKGEQQATVLSVVMDVTAQRETEKAVEAQLEELRRWHDATLGRESRILDLKREVNDLLTRLGQAPRYRSVQEEPETPPGSTRETMP